jgi:hypothetical protein
MALDRPFDPETKIASRAGRPDVIERGCDICFVGSGALGITALKKRIGANIEG